MVIIRIIDHNTKRKAKHEKISKNKQKKDQTQQKQHFSIKRLAHTILLLNITPNA